MPMKRFALAFSVVLAFTLSASGAQPDPRNAFDKVWEGENNGKRISYALKLTPEDIIVQEFNLKGRKWRQSKTASYVYFNPEARVSLGDVFESLEIEGERYCICSVLESFNGGLDLSYRLCAVKVSTGELVDLTFSGKNLEDPSALPDRYLIEGTSNAEMLPPGDSVAVGRLVSMMDSDPRLKVFPESLFLTDRTIAWWVENNPKAMSSAKYVQMPSIDAGASLASEFENARKVVGNRYCAALTDVRGYSVIVVRKNGSAECVLAWADQIPADKSVDRYVKSIYFQNDNTLAIIYYKGRSMFKYSLNLATHALIR